MVSDYDYLLPEKRQFSPLSATDRHRLLVEWNQTQTDYPKDKCVHQLFEQQVARSPNAEAVIFGEQRLTYHALNARANQLARYLKSFGVESEDLVGLCVERSVTMVVALLAILKAGGAYVPLDPSHPAERLQDTIADARINLVLTEPPFTGGFDGIEPEIICLVQAGDAIGKQSTDNLPCDLTSEHLAYVIYTSGSTGKPKGVAVPHRGINRLVINTNYIQFTSSDRVAQVSNASFDVATAEIWGALLNGAQLVGISREVLLSPETFATEIQVCKISILFLTTALLNEFAKTVPQAFQHLKMLIFGGEAANLKAVRAILKHGPPQHFLNVYGPTENTTVSSWYPIQDLSEEATTIPIGRPIANTQLYVLDSDREPVPVGEPGELYVGGDGLARGYLNRPELTEERFIRNPFIPANQISSSVERLYKTGDMVRYLPDGNLEFLGRIDTQVKIRGFRIELGEIEAVLAQHADVAAAVVVAHDRGLGDKRLVAYVVPQQPGQTPHQLREFYQEKLPDYMRPAVVVLLEILPLTPNGKIDRKALPTPDWTRPTLDTAYVAPRNSMEAELFAIWAEVLGIDGIGTHDSLFDLGGHSLIATQILLRVYDRFQVKLPVYQLFEKPTIAHLGQLIEQNSLTKSQERVLAIQPIPRSGYLPVSFAQERVYFLEKLSPNRAYQSQATLRFEGRLEIEALRQSFEEILRRHEIFRTTFTEIEGRLWQVIHPAPTVMLPVIDISAIPEGDRQAEVERLMVQEMQKPFDLGQLPLVRRTLVKLSDRDHLLIYIEHHMVHDGWSFNIFLRELVALYKAFSSGQPSPLPEPTLQFADFAHWQRQWVLGDAAKQQLLYWQQKLSGSLPLLELPYDRRRPTEQSYQGSSIRIELPLDLCASLRKLSRQTQKTLFMTMFAAFSILLQRYTRRDDLNVGTAVANRQMPGSEGLIGMIVNNLVLRTDLSGDPSFYDLLDRVGQVTLEGYANEDLPFDKVVDGINPARNLSHNPLFQVMFSFHDSPLSDLTVPELDITVHEAMSNQSAKFDLDVVVIPRLEQRVGRGTASDGVTGITTIWEYNSDIFERATIERMIEQYQTLLAGIVANPGGRLSEIPLLTAAQQQQLLVTWNDTQETDDRELLVHTLFEAQAALHSEAIAVRMADRSLTYDDLNRRANQLARHLQTLGVGPDVLVGLCLHRSLEMVVALLGILKAGGAYVPLDPAYPAERLTDMVDDARLSVLVTRQEWATLYARQSIAIVCLDRDAHAIAQHSEDNPQVVVEGKHLAYVIYTSGSTGKPKGVAIAHSSLANFTQGAIVEYGITKGDRVLQFASISFDAAAEEIYPCLSCGGTLVLRRSAMLKSVSDFIEQSRTFQVTVWDLPTAYWHLLCGELVSGNLTLPESLRLVIIGGERALPERVVQWRQKVGTAISLVNSYGPTETTVVATLCRLSTLTATELENREVPIGRPIRNLGVYVLDPYLQPVPIGVPGELYIGGAGVARGYLHRPDLTRERFIRDPFHPSPDARLYRTGDLVRYRSDGNLEFLGRIDSQVKIRGFRIELGEIETVLNQDPQVFQSVVMAREDSPGHKRLVAYIVAPRQSDPLHLNLDELRHRLKQTLPPYMVPSALVPLPSLPMTVNGKVDYQALPAPKLSDRPWDEVGEPRSHIEAKLVRIWATVLGLESVGIQDNFFQLGGDSIISIQMISQAARAGLQLTPKQLFQYQTIAELATVVSTTHAMEMEAEQGLVTGALPLTPIQHWFWEQKLPDSYYFNQSIRLESPSGFNPESLQVAIQQLLRHHDVLRLRWRSTDEGWQQWIAEPDETTPLQVVNLSNRDPVEQQGAIAAIEAELQGSFDLTGGPIMGMALFQLGSNQPEYLSIVVHHLAIDGVSWRILLEDFATAYQQLERNEPIQLPQKTTSFQTWANRLVTYGKSADLAAELQYWLAVAANPIPTLPVDYSWDLADPASRAIAATASVTVSLSREETRALLQDVSSTYNTQINDALLTALLQTITQWTGNNTLLLDLEGHGREDLFETVDLSRTVGWFTTLFPVSLTLGSDESVGETLKSVKEQLRRIPKRGIGYGVLRYLNPNVGARTQLQALPSAQVSFNYLGQLDRGLTASTPLGTPTVLKSEQSPRGHRSHLLGISGWVRAEQLEMTFTYSDRLHHQATIAQPSDRFIDALKTIIAHCQSPDAGGYTPSDFSASQLNQKQLDKLMSRINRVRRK